MYESQRIGPSTQRRGPWPNPKSMSGEVRTTRGDETYTQSTILRNRERDLPYSLTHSCDVILIADGDTASLCVYVCMAFRGGYRGGGGKAAKGGRG